MFIFLTGPYMVRVIIEHVPFGDESRKEVIGQLLIVDNATGTPDEGNYEFVRSKSNDPHTFWLAGKVLNYPRSGGIFELVARVFKSTSGGNYDMAPRTEIAHKLKKILTRTP